MARTQLKWTRVYVGGYDLSGYARSVGPLIWDFAEADLTCPMGDAAHGVLPTVATIGVGALNTVLDPTPTSGPLDVLKTPASRVITVPVGFGAAPAQGDPAFCGRWQQVDFKANEDGGASVLNVSVGDWDAANLIGYANPWGNLLHAKGEETAVNTAAGIDNPTGGQTTFGGYMVYQVFAASGGAITGVIKVQDASINSNANFGDITPVSLTTGVLDFTLPQAGIVAIPNTATIKQFTRWQIVLTTMTHITFALAFVRNYHIM